MSSESDLPKLEAPAVLWDKNEVWVIGSSNDATTEVWRCKDDVWRRVSDLPLSLSSPKARRVGELIVVVGRSLKQAHRLWLDPRGAVEKREDFNGTWLVANHWLDASGALRLLMDDDSRRLLEGDNAPPDLSYIASPPPSHFDYFDGRIRSDGSWWTWLFASPDSPGKNHIWRRDFGSETWVQVATIPVGHAGVDASVEVGEDLLLVRTDGVINRVAPDGTASAAGSLELGENPEAFWGGVALERK